MKNTIVLFFYLIIMAVTLLGCSDSQQSNNIIDIDKPLTQAQIDEIITLTNEALIKDIDYSQVTRPDAEEQARVNEKTQKLGGNLKGKVTVENKDIIIAQVNGEAVTLSDWYYEKISEITSAENKNGQFPTDEEIFADLVEMKVISSTARELGLYPPEEQVIAYIDHQREIMAELDLEEAAVLFEAWDITAEEYLVLMKDRFADNLAKANWGVYLENYCNLPEEEGYTAKSPLWIDDEMIEPLLENVEVEVTEEGRKLGINFFE